MRRRAPAGPLAILALLTLLALGLRVWGIAFGLPDLTHPDEPAHVLQTLAIAGGLPHGLTFGNPPLYKYLLLVEYAGDYGLGRLAGVYASPQDFIDRFHADPSHLYLIARLTSAALGTLTVWAAYALGLTLRGPRTGLLAAGLAAVAFLLVRESHFAVNDALATLVVTVGLLAAVRIVQGGGRRYDLLAGIALGLAFSSKYHGVALLVPLVLACFWSPHIAHGTEPASTLVAGDSRAPAQPARASRRPVLDARSTGLLLALGAALVAALVTFPSLVFETGRVVNDVNVGLLRRGLTGYDGLDPAGGYVYYLKVLAWGLGWPLAVTAGAGLLLAIWRRDRPLLVVAALPITLYAVMGAERMFFARFILPAVPALIVLAAVACDALLSRLEKRLAPGRRVLAPAAWLLAAVLLGALPLQDALRFDRLLTREDTRTQARAWIAAHLPAGARLALDTAPLAPALPSARYNLLIANGWSLPDLSIAAYRERGVDYLVVTSYNSERWLLDPAQDAQRLAFYAALAREAQPMAVFRPYAGGVAPGFVYDQIYAPLTELDRLERPGPTVTVYQIAPLPP